MIRRDFLKLIGIGGVTTGAGTIIGYPMPLEKIGLSNSSSNGGGSSSPSTSVSPNPPEPEFCKELQFGEVFDGRIVSMTTFRGELWIATERRVYAIKERNGQAKD